MTVRQTRKDAAAGRVQDWRRQNSSAIRSRGDLEAALLASSLLNSPDAAAAPARLDEAEACLPAYGMKITPYYFGLIERFDPSDPIFLQAVPRRRERAQDPAALADPVGDRSARFRAAETVIHRYGDRALFIPTWMCHLNCRFCFRRGRERNEKGGVMPPAAVDEGIATIAARPGIREVIVTGGDPLTLDDGVLFELLKRIAGIPHVRTLRVHTRIPAVNPFRLTNTLCRGLAGVGVPLWVVTQFNHPRELTAAARSGLAELVTAGVPVLNQSVLLRGVNDCEKTLEELLRALIEARVKPYYLHHPDRAQGTAHFRVPLWRGVRIVKSLRGRLPGFAIPHYVLDIPGGSGKIPLEHAWVEKTGKGSYRLTAPDGSCHDYVDDFDPVDDFGTDRD